MKSSMTFCKNTIGKIMAKQQFRNIKDLSNLGSDVLVIISLIWCSSSSTKESARLLCKYSAIVENLWFILMRQSKIWNSTGIICWTLIKQELTLELILLSLVRKVWCTAKDTVSCAIVSSRLKFCYLRFPRSFMPHDIRLFVVFVE